ncbi:GGLO oxidase, partial [Tachuris rubrigastra]|nr:GGLO oxidase [Tachuris rubrigastra]
QILALAQQRGRRVKVVGGGHSPSDIACTDGFLIHMGKMNRVLQVDRDRRQVTVEGGILLSQLNQALDGHGLALPNLGAVSEVTAAGVIGTGTHNTGITHGILPTQVVSVTLLTASGEILECSEFRNSELFPAVRLHLGCLGVVLSVTFQCVPAFRLHEVAFPDSLGQVLSQLDHHLRSSQYFRFLWFPHSDNVRIIYQDPTARARPQFQPGMPGEGEGTLWEWPPSSSSSWFWDCAVGYHLLEFLLWLRWEQRDRERGIFQDLPHPGSIPCFSTGAALLDLRAALEGNPGVVAHFPVEVRFAKRDEVWLSPCFQRDSCFINVILYRPYGKDVPKLEYWRIYEEIMRKHGGRPHWAKAHSCTRKELEKMFPAFPKFCSVRERLDPTGIFLNPYLERVFC